MIAFLGLGRRDIADGRDPASLQLWNRIEVLGGNAGIRGAHDPGTRPGGEADAKPTQAARDELARQSDAYAALGFNTKAR